MGNEKSSLDFLELAIHLGLAFDMEQDSAFWAFKNHAEFEEIQTKIEHLKQPIYNSKAAFSLSEKDMIPEGIAYDPVEQNFYLGSTYKSKVVKVDINGIANDFAKQRQDGLRTVLGMKVDAKRGILWVCSTVNDPPPKNVNREDIGWSGIFKYDLKTGRLIKKYTVQQQGETHLFNDISLTKQGDVFITDSGFSAIYIIPHQKDELELFLKSDAFSYPHGIALFPDEKTLCVANWGIGIFTIDIKTKDFSLIASPDSITTYGIDGLYFYENSLIAVQNGMDWIVLVASF